MRIECLSFDPFREDVDEETVRRGTDAETIGQLRRELEADYPALETPLEEGDPIRLTPSVYGG